MDVLAFYDENFPFEGIKPCYDDLKTVLNFADICDADNLDKLLNDNYKCFISFHGCYFPESGFEHIYNFLTRGNGLICLGGKPLSKPAVLVNGLWVVISSTNFYYRKLGIHHFEKVDKQQIDSIELNESYNIINGFESCIDVQDTYQLIMQAQVEASHGDDLKTENIEPINFYGLLFGITSKKLRICTPILAVEHTAKEFQGGRWIFINQCLNKHFWNNKGIDLLEQLSIWCTSSSVEICIISNYAAYHESEQPCMLLQYQSLKKSEINVNVRMTILKDGDVKSVLNIELLVLKQWEYMSIPVDFKVSPGFYEVSCDIYIEGFLERNIKIGFWGYNKNILELNDNVNIFNNKFLRNENFSYIVGISYEFGNYQNGFLNSINPYAWNCDFKLLRESGINVIEICLYKSTFLECISFEEILRALDAFILTAKSNGLHIMLCLFEPEENQSTDRMNKYISVILSKYINSDILLNVTNRKSNKVLYNYSDKNLITASSQLQDEVPYVYDNLALGCVFNVCSLSGNADNIFKEFIINKRKNHIMLVKDNGFRYIENIDGSNRWDEHKERNVIEKKFAYSYVSSAGGMFQLLHNKAVDSEFYSGCLRDDGTVKPQLRVAREFGRFINNVNILLKDREIEQVVIARISDSNEIVTKYIDKAIEQAVKVLSYDLKVNIRIVKGSNISDIDNSKSIIIPSIGFISDEVWSILNQKVINGAVLLFSGPVNYNIYGNKVDRLVKYTGNTKLIPVANEEELKIGDEFYRVTYNSDIINFANKEILEGEKYHHIHIINIGSGKIIWCPMPIELNGNIKVINEVYKVAMREAKIQRDLIWTRGNTPGIFARKISYSNGYVLVFISEIGIDREIEVADRSTGMTLSFILPSDRIRLLAFDQNNSLIDSYNTECIKV